MNSNLLGFFAKDIELPPPLWENNPAGFLVLAHPSKNYPTVPIKSGGGFSNTVTVLSQDEFLSEFRPAEALHAAWADALAELKLSLAGNAPLHEDAQSFHLFDAVCRLCRSVRDLPGPDARRAENDLVREVVAAANFSADGGMFNHILVDASISHRRAGNLHQAVFYYCKALESDPSNPNIMFNLSRVYHELGADEEARDVLKRILSFNPDMQVARQYLDFLKK